MAQDFSDTASDTNAQLRELVEQGYATLVSTGHHREKNIILTEEGRRYAAKVMGEMKLAEREALSETLKHFSPEFIDAFDFFSQSLCRSLEEHGLK